MLTKTVTYIDLNGKEVTDTLYFNMTKSEIAAMQVRMDGMFIDHLKDLVEGKHIEKLFHVFRDIVLDSYGEKSEDGRRFIKNQKLRDDFESSLAFDAIFTEILMDPDKQSAFVREILPPDMRTGGEINAEALPPVT